MLESIIFIYRYQTIELEYHRLMTNALIDSEK